MRSLSSYHQRRTAPSSQSEPAALGLVRDAICHQERMSDSSPTAVREARDQARRDCQFRFRFLRVTGDLLLRQHRPGIVRAGGQGVDGAARCRREGEATPATPRTQASGEAFAAP